VKRFDGILYARLPLQTSVSVQGGQVRSPERERTIRPLQQVLHGNLSAYATALEKRNCLGFFRCSTAGQNFISIIRFRSRRD